MVEKPTLNPTFQVVFVTHFLMDSKRHQHGDFASQSVLVEQISNGSSFTWSTFSSVLLVVCCPKYVASSTGVTLLLKMDNHSKICVVPTHYLLTKSYFQHLESLCSIFPSLKQNSCTTMLRSLCFWVVMECMSISVYQGSSELSSTVEQSKQILLRLLLPWRWDQ